MKPTLGEYGSIMGRSIPPCYDVVEAEVRTTHGLNIHREVAFPVPVQLTILSTKRLYCHMCTVNCTNDPREPCNLVEFSFYRCQKIWVSRQWNFLIIHEGNTVWDSVQNSTHSGFTDTGKVTHWNLQIQWKKFKLVFKLFKILMKNREQSTVDSRYNELWYSELPGYKEVISESPASSFTMTPNLLLIERIVWI